MITDNNGSGDNTANEPVPNLDNFLGGGLPPMTKPQSDASGEGVNNDTNQGTPAPQSLEGNNNNPAPSSGDLTVPPSNGDIEETFEGLISKISSETIQPDDVDTRDTLLSTFKASKVDATGNLLNDKGEVVLSSEKLRAYLEAETLPLDDKGNMVNDKGEIIRTKEQLLADNSVVLFTKSRLETELGISFPADLELEDTEEGLAQLAIEAAKVKSTNAIKNFLDSRPAIKAYYQHLALGGSPDNFNSAVIDYKSIDIKNLADDAKIKLLKDSFTKQGNPNPDQMIEYIKKAGNEELNKAVAGAVLYLDKTQEARMTEQSKQLAEREKEAQEEANQYWGQVTEKVNKGRIGNVNIPIAERQAFLDYVSKPVTEDGRSKDMVDSENDTLDFELMMSFLRYKGADLSKLVANLAAQEKVNTLRDRVAKNKAIAVTSGVPQNTNGKQGVKTPNLETLLKQGRQQ